MRKRIQKSMMFILIAILVPIYLIMSVVVYQRNLNILEGEIKQEAAYIKRAVDLSGTEYLAQLDSVDQGTRVTLIASTGEVLYDSRNDGSTMENHRNRAEVQQALKNGTGEKIRMSDTVSKELYYYAVLLDDGNVLRVSKSMDSLMWTSLNILPVVIGIGIIGLVLAWFLAKWQTNRLMEPVIHLDLENPLDNVVYEEMTPLLEAMDKQNKEKEAVANMRKEFSANVSHELKTPLTSISGYAEIMMNGLVRPEDIPRFSETIYKEARRLLTLIEDIIKISKIPILDTDNQDTVFSKLSILGSEMINDVISDIANNKVTPIKQNEEEVTFAYNLTKEDELINFHKTATEVFNQIRGLNSNPGGHFTLDGINIKVYNSKVSLKHTDFKEGTIVDINKDSFDVACKDGTVISILELKVPSKNKMFVRDFMNGQGKNMIVKGKVINQGE